MFANLRMFVNLVTLLLAASLHPAFGKGLEERNWIELSTPNFRMRSVLSELNSTDLIRQLEEFREVVSVVTNLGDVESRIPSEIYVLRSRSDLVRLGIDPDFAGSFSAGLRKNVIIMYQVGGRIDNHIIMHEYVHFLLRNHRGGTYPPWFHEGFAEYLSSTRLSDGKLEVGAAPAGTTLYRRSGWKPMKLVILTDSVIDWPARERRLYYTQSWALVHFLLNRRVDGRSFGQNMALYAELVETGTGRLDAFEQAFAVPVDDLDALVREYAEQRTLRGYRLEPDDLKLHSDPEISSLSKEEVSLSLGQLAMKYGKKESAMRWFDIALADESSRPGAETEIGKMLTVDGEFDAALGHFERSVALAPEDPYCQLDFAWYWVKLAEASVGQDTRAELLSRARSRFTAAQELDELLPEPYLGYAYTLVLEDQNIDHAVELLEFAAQILPSDITVRGYLAEAYLKADGRADDAIATARTILAWAHGDSPAARRARAIISRLTGTAE